MADQEIESGDMVTLKSGGPVMTVKKVAGGKARTVWIDTSGIRHAAFDPVALKIHRHRVPRAALCG